MNLNKIFFCMIFAGALLFCIGVPLCTSIWGHAREGIYVMIALSIFGVGSIGLFMTKLKGGETEIRIKFEAIKKILRKMGIMAIMCWFIFGNAPPVFSQSQYAEVQYFTDSPTSAWRLESYNSSPIKGKLTGFKIFAISKDYAEGYGGLGLSANDFNGLEIGGGIETHQSVWRIGGSVSLGNRRVSSLFIWDYGGSGFWCRETVEYSVSKNIKGGILYQKNEGVGPRLDLETKKVRIWTSWLWQKNNNQLATGFAILF